MCYFFSNFLTLFCRISLSFLILIQLSTVTAYSKQFEKQESPAEMRQIVAQALCLSEGYPESQISKDASVVFNAYVDALGAKIKLKNISKIKELAKSLKPATSTSMEQHNFAIAKCVLFAHQKDVLRLLGN